MNVIGPRSVKLNETYKVFVAANGIDPDSRVVVQFGPEGNLYQNGHTNFAEEVSFKVRNKLEIRNFVILIYFFKLGDGWREKN